MSQSTQSGSNVSDSPVSDQSQQPAQSAQSTQSTQSAQSTQSVKSNSKKSDLPNPVKSKLVIIGSGPSGYSAAIYASRALLEPVMIAGMESGGQLMYTSDLENFPGFPQGVKGPQFMFSLKEQAERFGTNIKFEHVTAVDFSSRPFKLWTKLPEGIDHQTYKFGRFDQIVQTANQVKKQPHQIEAEAVIVSTGATATMLGVQVKKSCLVRELVLARFVMPLFIKRKMFL
ncbi:MAG: hypothetical protein GF381_03130 [Candidatus Pacebacteria bacterium]|nr:hypothetical protein [Candidatus Paceibacterota bacterium]